MLFYLFKQGHVTWNTCGLPISRRFDARFAEDGSILIVGGLGGLGRAMCRWIASCKCKHIIVISRSGMEGKNARSLVTELASLDVKLAVYAFDVGSLHQLEQTLSRCAKEMPPVRGVIQSAMVIEVRFSVKTLLRGTSLSTNINPRTQ